MTSSLIHEALGFLLPADLGLLQLVLLAATSFATALITAVAGVGGGVALLAVTASLLPPLAVIPVHGLVQAGANSHRALLTRQYIHRPLILDFALGAVAGALLASLVMIRLPGDIILVCVGAFVLYLTWGPALPAQSLQGWPLRLAAALTTLASMLVGATGPLVAAFTRQISAERYVRLANFSACMTLQHGLKLLVFGTLGFALSDWLGVILSMIASGLAGTWMGLKLLSRISNQAFNQVFKWMLTLLALRLLYTGLPGLF